VIVLDCSAVLAIALKEPGSARVLATVPQAILSAANLAEVLIVVERKGGDADQIGADIENLGIPIVPIEKTHAEIAAKIRRAYPTSNLSLGDCLCMALAVERNCEVLTSDREMTKVALGITVTLFR
jgi:ribonuclease VapC